MDATQDLPDSRPTGGDAAQLSGIFGRYRIERRLGEGGMGAVYLAEDTQLRRLVALKVPKFAQGAEAKTLERFYREARSAARLDHPNICAVYDVGEVQGTHYLSMAYIEGRPLSEFIRADKPQLARHIAKVIRKLALALAEAHDRGVIHRDLKPANVMIDRRGEPIIMDFGLARHVEEDRDARLTGEGAIIGSPAYMSPEQIQGEQQLGPATDIYSLGVVLYELMTGVLPFPQKGSVISVLSKILTEAPKSPGEVNPAADPALVQICLKAMAKKPEARYASMREFADALTAFLKSELQSATTVKTAKPQEPAANSDDEVDPFAAALGASGVASAWGPNSWPQNVAGVASPGFHAASPAFNPRGQSPAAAQQQAKRQATVRWSIAAIATVGMGAVVWLAMGLAGDDPTPTPNAGAPQSLAPKSLNQPPAADVPDRSSGPHGSASGAITEPQPPRPQPRQPLGEPPLQTDPASPSQPQLNEGTPPGMRDGGPPTVDQIFARHDANGDNQLSRDEVPPERENEMFRGDTNRDNRLDRAELEALHRRLPPPPNGEGANRPSPPPGGGGPNRPGMRPGAGGPRP